MENSLEGGIVGLTALVEDKCRANLLFGQLALLALFFKGGFELSTHIIF